MKIQELLVIPLKLIVKIIELSLNRLRTFYIKKSRFSDSQNIVILNQSEAA